MLQTNRGSRVVPHTASCNCVYSKDSAAGVAYRRGKALGTVVEAKLEDLSCSCEASVVE